MTRKEYRRAYYLKNREKSLAASKQWALDNPEKNKASSKKWREENKPNDAARASARRARILERTPEWADKDALDFPYFAADVIQKVYGGTKPHVDHIVPLQGENVCGLHVRENLQLLSAKDNLSKYNSFTVG